MAKATIKQIGQFTVALSYDDEMTGDRVTREFWVPRNDGVKYVREGNRQVCEGLGQWGNTLSVKDAAELLPLIRKEWRRFQARSSKYSEWRFA